MDPAGETRIVGTRVPGIASTSTWLDGVAPGDGAILLIASAYWDAAAFTRAEEVAESVGAEQVRLLLWTAGSTKSGWQSAHAAAARASTDIRFVDSPNGGGIFHIKLTALAASDGEWLRAYVGSANWTGAAHAKNLEMGVALGARAAELPVLRAWFDAEYEQATRSSDIDWQRAFEIAPQHSEASARRKIFAAAKLARPVRSTPIA